MNYQSGYTYHTVVINHRVYPYYCIVKPRAKSLFLRINQSQQIIVTTPPQISQAEIERFVIAHAAEIVRFWQYQAQWLPFNLKTKMIRFFGQEFKIVTKTTKKRQFDCYIVTNQASNFTQEFHFIVPQIYVQDLDKQTTIITKWCRKFALKYLGQRLNDHCLRLNIVRPKLLIHTMVNKWGWCNQNQTICFNTWLVCCSWDVIDYVICHELAHLTYLDHHRLFWKLLATYYPNYQAVLKKLTFDLD